MNTELNFEIKQIMPAEGWRVIIATRDADNDVSVYEPAVIGWAVVHVTGFRDGGEETSVDLLMYYRDDVMTVRQLRCWSPDDDERLFHFIVPPKHEPPSEEEIREELGWEKDTSQEVAA